MLNTKHILVTFALLATLFVAAQPSGYTYGKRLMIQASQIPGSSTLNNFTVLISLTDNNLRTIANGGHVANSNGYDILFTLADCNTVLSHQIERYNASTGELIAWVKIPSLSATANTPIFMYYGNAAVNSNPSTTSVWAAGMQGRFHMNQNPNTSSLTDYSGNSNNSASYNGSMNSGSQVSGKIGYGMAFNGSQYVDIGNNIVLTGNYTMSAWIKSNQSDANFHGFFGSAQATDSQRSPGLWVIGNTGIHYGRSTNNGSWCSNMTGNGYITNGSNASWHYISYVYNGTDQRLYIDGVLQQTYSSNCNSSGNYTLQPLNTIGRCDNYFTGSLDELSVTTSALSSNWIATEFNNQNSPSSFITVSTEYTASTLCGLLPVEMTEFNAEVQDNHQTDLRWSTASERANAYFVVCKSKDAQSWEEIGKVEGNGTVKSVHHYFFADENPYAGITYYRIKQVDQDGSINYSDIVSASVEAPEVFAAFPIPAKNELTVRFPQMLTSAVDVSMINQMGQHVYSNVLNAGEQTTTVALNTLENGMYLLVVNPLDGKDPIYKKVIVQH